MVNQLLLTEDNIENFRAVLPPAIGISPERITIGCYDEDGTVLGAMSFTMTSYEYEIDWLYVVPEYRRKGTATKLMERFFAFIKKTGEVYPASAAFEVTDDDMSLYNFFLTVDEMDVSFSHERFYVDFSEIAASKELEERVDGKFEEKMFFKLDKKEQDKILGEIKDDGIFVIDNREKWEDRCALNLCRVIYSGDKLEGAIFIMWRNDGNLELSYLYSHSPLCTKRLLHVTSKYMLKMEAGDKLVFDAVAPRSDLLARRLFPKNNAVNIYKAEW